MAEQAEAQIPHKAPTESRRPNNRHIAVRGKGNPTDFQLRHQPHQGGLRRSRAYRPETAAKATVRGRFKTVFLRHRTNPHEEEFPSAARRDEAISGIQPLHLRRRPFLCRQDDSPAHRERKDKQRVSPGQDLRRGAHMALRPLRGVSLPEPGRGLRSARHRGDAVRQGGVRGTVHLSA